VIGLRGYLLNFSGEYADPDVVVDPFDAHRIFVVNVPLEGDVMPLRTMKPDREGYVLVYDEKRKTLYRYKMPKRELKFERIDLVSPLVVSHRRRDWFNEHGVFNPVYPIP
jgi:hypothetical protein